MIVNFKISKWYDFNQTNQNYNFTYFFYFFYQNNFDVTKIYLCINNTLSNFFEQPFNQFYPNLIYIGKKILYSKHFVF